MIPFKKLTLAAAIGGLMAGTGAAQASTVLYSTFGNQQTGAGITGQNKLTNGSGVGPWRDSSNVIVANPGYSGNLPSTWYAGLGANDSANVCTSASTCSTPMPSGMQITKLNVGSLAYQDYSGASATNWSHNADFGLFKLTANTQKLTITLSADGSDLSPGFSVWQGWDTLGDSNRHQGWRQNGAPDLLPGQPGIMSSSLGTFLGTAYTLSTGGSATLELFDLLPGQYTIIMGGHSDKIGDELLGGLGGAQAQYKVQLATTTVPLPAAAWLFGSALAGLGVFGRRRGKTSAMAGRPE